MEGFYQQNPIILIKNLRTTVLALTSLLVLEPIVYMHTPITVNFLTQKTHKHKVADMAFLTNLRGRANN